ncbi:AMP-binding protein [Nocardioides sp. CF8]|uniref:AMP-binding protein n=1 Tax=Nocardioides sp. CF8 TaxID=110319 RepID=UPI0018DC6EE9|nr:AMP-binding protein [Nocardioides sp. CF8]
MTTTPHLRRAARPLEAHLASFGDRVALRAGGRTLSYAELAGRVRDVAHAYAGARRLVLLVPGHDIESVVEYLGALSADQVVLVAGSHADALAQAWDPDVIVASPGRGAGRVFRRDVSAHALHEDLAVLLSTSGTTGSPKLVRLSRDGLLANADAIAQALAIRADDVAATTLPLHYCYGLSVLHSHLLMGAGLLLTDACVLDECFWSEVAAHGVTTIPGVPHTFELLERSGFADRSAPSLRTLTQAGGRMSPERVRAFAELGQRRGFDLFVMYGATEASARMSVLPANLAATAPTSIGLPLPGAHMRIEAPSDDGVGELVFTGPNVMLGYASVPADLALGRTVSELHTGDLARQRRDGLWEIVGRSNRIAKVCGLRLDLDHLERELCARSFVVAAADGGDRLVVGVTDGARPVDVPALLLAATELTGVPAALVDVVVLPDLPRLASGKIDYRALAAPRSNTTTTTTRPRAGVVSPADVTALLATVLARPDAQPTHSFVDLGGDSLSYVEAALRLERLLGELPSGWPAMPAAALADAAGPRRRGSAVETNVVLRALGIFTIVASHAGLFSITGGAHVLLAIVGFNLGRFQLGERPRRERTGAILRGLARVVVPSVLVIGTVAMFSPDITWKQAALITSLTEWAWSEPRWSYWFIEAIVFSTLLLAGLLAVPAVDRASRRWPFAFPVTLTIALAPARFDLFGIPGDHVHRINGMLWLVTLGWAISQARTVPQRLVVSALTLTFAPGFFNVGGPIRPAYLVVGLLALTWLPRVRLPVGVASLVGVLAASSLWIYLLHWRVYPALEVHSPVAAIALSLLVGVAAAEGVRRGAPPLRRLTRRLGNR